MAALALTLPSSSSSAGAGEAIAVRAVDGEGLAAALASERGKVVVLNFWATWCEPCREEFPDLVRFAREHDESVSLVTVSLDAPGEADRSVRAFLAEASAPGVTLIRCAGDPDAFINGVDPSWSGALPATFVYARDGRRVQGVHGSVTYDDLARMTSAAQADDPGHGR
jgi:thiol-disulfide isomerase/thioredoxin